MKITLPVIPLPPLLKVDRSATLKFSTRELTNEEVGIIRDSHNQEGWLLYSPNEIDISDLPKTPAEANLRSSSQRLRGVIFLLWKQQGEVGGFETFYRDHMESLIDFVKR